MAGPDGITTRDTVALYHIPTAMSPTALMADEAVCARPNSPPTSAISGRPARRGVPAGFKGILAPTGPGDAAPQASCPRTRVVTGQGLALANFPRIRARTARVLDARPDQSVRPTGLLRAASGAVGVVPKRPPATGEVHSAVVALRRAVSSATAELAAWAAAAFVVVAVVAAVAAVVAGVDPFPES